MIRKGTFDGLGTIGSCPEDSVGIDIKSVADVVGDFRCSLYQLRLYMMFNCRTQTVAVKHKTRSAPTSLANLATRITRQS